MPNRDERIEDGQRVFGDWVRDQVDGRWPDAETGYRGRARNGDHFWEIQVPALGFFCVAASEGVLADPADRRAAQEELTRARWLDRLPDVETGGLLVKEGGRVFQWVPEKDETFGPLR